MHLNCQSNNGPLKSLKRVVVGLRERRCVPTLTSPPRVKMQGTMCSSHLTSQSKHVMFILTLRKASLFNSNNRIHLEEVDVLIHIWLLEGEHPDRMFRKNYIFATKQFLYRYILLLSLGVLILGSVASTTKIISTTWKTCRKLFWFIMKSFAAAFELIKFQCTSQTKLFPMSQLLL